MKFSSFLLLPAVVLSARTSLRNRELKEKAGASLKASSSSCPDDTVCFGGSCKSYWVQAAYYTTPVMMSYKCSCAKSCDTLDLFQATSRLFSTVEENLCMDGFEPSKIKKKFWECSRIESDATVPTPPITTTEATSATTTVATATTTTTTTISTEATYYEEETGAPPPFPPLTP